MDKKVIEVEHENLILGNKLIELYEEKIKRLEARVVELESIQYQPPVRLPQPVIHPRLRTTSEIIRTLELRSLKAAGKVGE